MRTCESDLMRVMKLEQALMKVTADRDRLLHTVENQAKAIRDLTSYVNRPAESKEAG